MIAHFVGFNKWNNIWLIHFSLKPIFQPLKAPFLPICVTIRKKRRSPKNTNIFICWPILTHDISFCRYQRKKHVLVHTFFSKINISPPMVHFLSFSGLPLWRTRSRILKRLFFVTIGGETLILEKMLLTKSYFFLWYLQNELSCVRIGQ